MIVSCQVEVDTDQTKLKDATERLEESEGRKDELEVLQKR